MSAPAELHLIHVPLLCPFVKNILNVFSDVLGAPLNAAYKSRKSTKISCKKKIVLQKTLQNPLDSPSWFDHESGLTSKECLFYNCYRPLLYNKGLSLCQNI